MSEFFNFLNRLLNIRLRLKGTSKLRLHLRFLYNIGAIENAVSYFWKFDFSNFKMTFPKGYTKKVPYVTDSYGSYKVLLFDKILFCYF